MARSRTATVAFTDDHDSRQKKSLARFTAETNPAMAERMAQAIASNVDLLSGLTEMVKRICKHDKPRAILSEVFARPGISKRFPHAYKAFVNAELFS